MGNKLFSDLDERVEEINQYFTFVKNLNKGTTRLCTDNNGKNKISKIDSELEKTLKATAFLLLYNLVESTMRNAIEAIFEEISNRSISFDELRSELKSIIIKNFKQNYSTDNLMENITLISVDIISVTFDKSKLFSGNLDARKIRDTARDYGFSSQTNSRKTRDGIDLLKIKTNRNDLAHGFKSFNDIGKDTSVEDLLAIETRVVSYLREILQNIETYLDNQEYLDSNEKEIEI